MFTCSEQTDSCIVTLDVLLIIDRFVSIGSYSPGLMNLQASSIKLSLEKYAGIASVLSQGGDAAGLVSDISSLKQVNTQPNPLSLITPTQPMNKLRAIFQVAKLNGLEGRTKTTKAELVQMLCTCRLGSAYIRSQEQVWDNLSALYHLMLSMLLLALVGS